MRKVKNNHIIQDTGTGGAWPVSSDRVVWAMAAWEIYTYTGDRKWLESAFQIILNSVNADARTIHDRQTGLMRGESSFSTGVNKPIRFGWNLLIFMLR